MLGIVVIIVTYPTSFVSYIILISSSFIFLGIAFVSESYINKLRGMLKRDSRARASIVELLRETEGYIAKEENWSTLERAYFRIRLSRFEIG